MLRACYDETNTIEIGIDEAGRGPLFGRVYMAGVILPKDFYHKDVKDSKKIKSHKKLAAVAEYIKEHAVAWRVEYVEHDVIDRINILQAVFEGMHACARALLPTDETALPGCLILVDGDRFKPYTVYNDDSGELIPVRHQTVEGGDATYASIAAASILAKWTRDEYIRELCIQYPELVTRYGIDTNMGYGTKRHLEGILEHGISQWHRTTYARCAGTRLNPVGTQL